MRKASSLSFGFTLIELMMTLTIMGIVLVVGVPSMQSMIINDRLTTTTNSIVGAFHVARSESIKRNKLVFVNKIGNEWDDGWEVFVDLNANKRKDQGDEVVQSFEAVNNSILINVPSIYANYIYFRPDGRSNRNGSFYVCSSTEKKFKRIVVSYSGRIRTESQDISRKVYANEC
jgi:type IV fimbrial biogenesis protein FimT